MPENPESPVEIPPVADASRRNFLRLASAGGVGAAALFLAACGSDDDSDSTSTASGSSSTSTSSDASTTPSDENDLKIANYALTLEYLEADFYAKVVDAKVLKGAQQEIAKKFGDQEQDHVDALTSMIKKAGGTPATKPKTKFDVSSASAVLDLAATVENVGAAAYLGQAANIKSPEILAAALSIHSVEARHAAALAQLLGKKVTPDGAFAKPMDMATVLKTVQPFIAS